MRPKDRVYEALTYGSPDIVPWIVKHNHLPRGELERKLRNLGMGISLTVSVVRTRVKNVVVKEIVKGDYLVRIYETPLGEVSEKIRINLPSEAGERSSSWKVEYFIKEPKDYHIVEYIWKNTKYEPSYDDVMIIERDLGNDGVVYTSGGYTPLMELIVNIMGFRKFAIEFKRNKSKVESLMEVIVDKKRELYKIISNSPVRIVLVGDNIDEVLVDKRLFSKYCIPYYQEFSDILHKGNKIVGSHMDGRLKSLKELILETNLDFIHGFTPPPGGNLSLKEAMKLWRNKVAIWVNLPEPIFYWDNERIKDYIISLLKEASPGYGLVLGITETVPPLHRMRVYEVVTKVVNKYGKIPIRIL